MNLPDSKSVQLLEDLQSIWSTWRRQKTPLYLFVLLSLNLLAAPAVYAATDGTFSRTQAYAIALLGLATVALSIYLFVVIFEPERF